MSESHPSNPTPNPTPNPNPNPNPNPHQVLHMSESHPSNRDDSRLLPLWSPSHTREGLS